MEAIRDSELGTPECEELDALTDLVVLYEIVVEDLRAESLRVEEFRRR